MKAVRFATFMAALVLALGMMLLTVGTPVAYAQQCANGDAGDNMLDCTDGDLNNWLGLAGNDTMTNVDGSVILGSINGGDDNDTIVNNGEVGMNISGGGGANSGNDTIINNGTVGSNMAGGDGEDTLINNGAVGNSINGGNGADTLINNGTVVNSINGSDGNDRVVNNGNVEGNIWAGADNDTVIVNGSVGGIVGAGTGDDTVTLTENADVAGVVNGGADTDTLIFNMQFESTAEGFAALEAQVAAWATELASANPNGGTIVINGNTFTWNGFEDLFAMLRANLVMFSDGRLNPFDLAATAIVYCGSSDVIIFTPEGEQALRVPAASLMGASAQTVVAEALGISLSAMPADVAQVTGPGGYTFDFSPALCVIN